MSIRSLFLTLSSLLILFMSVVWGVWSVLDALLRTRSFVNATFYILLLAFIVWIWGLWNAAEASKFNVWLFIKNNRAGVLLSLLVTLLAFAFVPKGYKALPDEANLVSTSRVLAAKQQPLIPFESAWQNGRFMTSSEIMATRPCAYLFVVQALHRLTGYRIENAFYLNTVLLLLFLITTYAFVKALSSPSLALTAVLMIGSHPILFTQSASASFEMLHLFLSVFTLLIFWHYLRTKSEHLFYLLSVSLMILAYTRYEAALSSFIVITALLYLGMVPWKDIRARPIRYSLLPLIILPVIWQRLSFVDKTSFDYYSGVKGDNPAVFAISYIAQNCAALAKDFRTSLTFFPCLIVVLVFGLCGGGIYAWNLIRQTPSANRDWRSLAAVAAINFTLLTLIYLSFIGGGNPLSIFSGRYYLLQTSLLSIMAAWLLHRLLGGRRTWLALILGCAFTGQSLTFAARDDLANHGVLISEYSYVKDFLKTQDPKKTLFITYRSSMYVPLGINVMTIDKANKVYPYLLELRNKRIMDRIVVGQRVSTSSGLALEDHQLIGLLRLRLIQQRPIDNDQTYRISEIVG